MMLDSDAQKEKDRKEQETRSILTRIVRVEGLTRNHEDTLFRKKTLARPFATRFDGPVSSGTPASAPTNTIAAGAVTQNRDWAYTYYSPENNRETPLSATSTANLAVQKNTLEGARSTNSQHTAVRIYTRLNGSGDSGWYLVAQIANPASGTWTYLDNSPISAYALNGAPNVFERVLFPSCAVGNRLRRVKVFWDFAYTRSDSAYWELWLSIRGQGTGLDKWRSQMQSTARVGLDPNLVYFVPFLAPQGGDPNPDLDLPIEENDRVILGGRGVGAISFLPGGTAIVEVTGAEV